MKNKLLLLATLLGFIGINQAQITLTSTDNPIKGLQVVEATDTAPTISLGGSGAQTWNFTGIKQTKLDTFQFLDPSTTPGNAFFPSANLSLKTTLIPGFIAYLDSKNTGLSFVGLYNFYGFPVFYSTPQPFLSDPATAGTSYTGQYNWQIHLPNIYAIPGIDSLWRKHQNTYASVMDAWGNVTTNLGTFNCLRQKLTEIQIDSIYVKGPATGGNWVWNGNAVVDTTIHYRFRHHDFQFPAAEVDTKADGTIIQARSALYIPTVNGLPVITLTQSDNPIAGLYVLESTDTVATVTPGGTGAQTWDFTAIKEQKVDTLQFAAASATPGNQFFPGANLTVKTTLIPGFYGYFNSQASGLDFVGLFNPAGGFPVFYTSPEPFLTDPSTALTSYSGQYTYQLKFPPYPAIPGVDSLWIRHSNDYNSIMDAWGNVTTQLGTFNSLRQNLTERQTDSTFIKGVATGGNWVLYKATADTTIHYRFRHHAFKFSVVEFDVKPNGTVVQARRARALPIITGIDNAHVSIQNSNAYPNPAFNELNIDLKNIGNVEAVMVFDYTGRQIANVKTSGTVIQLNTGDYSSGMYIYKLVDKNSNQLGSGKFSVAK